MDESSALYLIDPSPALFPPEQSGMPAIRIVLAREYWRAMGRKGGQAKTERKAEAARANGLKAGRPPIRAKSIARQITEFAYYVSARLPDV